MDDLYPCYRPSWRPNVVCCYSPSHILRTLSKLCIIQITLLTLFTLIIVDSVGNRWCLDLRRTNTPADGNPSHHRDTTSSAGDCSDPYRHTATHGHSNTCRNDNSGHHYCDAYNDSNQQSSHWQCGCRRLWESFFSWWQLSIHHQHPCTSICPSR